MIKNYIEEKSLDLVKTTEKYLHKMHYSKTYRAARIKLKLVKDSSIKGRASYQKFKLS